MNFVLLKVAYTAYGDRRAFFVNQAINLLYILYGGLILYPRMLFTTSVTPEMRRYPKKHFLLMGFLDSLGTFFTCMGTAYTPGSLTPLLNQLLIPFTMVVSAAYIRTRYSSKEMAGALLIVAGACVSVVPSLLQASASDSLGSNIRWYAVIFYAMSNVPMAMSACYKESKFDKAQLDVWYLTQWVSIFQFLVSFVYMPLLVLPGFGSQDGMSWSDVVSALSDGMDCYLERVPECAEQWTFLLLTGYCGVNVCFNTLGLYLTKHGSAVLNSLSYSILLPFTTCLFFTPLLGSYQEPITTTSAFTFSGLVLALAGFAVYQRYTGGVGAPEATASKASEALLGPAVPPGALANAQQGQPSFQERIVGVQRTKKIVRSNSI
eukprot:TRINITY_DN4509_c0_g3_i2.p1 TRINITY_DN4509_c0_g3~~TRINITY_DN4509_c0_g3_i2.p1  ORF type:complete len:431 (+),score=84.43 TRINITY_DN4509_c0_g3_i2:165-1295(+)